MSVLIIGIFFVGMFMAVWAATHTPKKKVKWGDEYAPRVVTTIHVKRKTR